jgi:dihydrofolate reductase
MGRKTYESIGKPLPNRLNICITSIPEKYTNINEKIIFVASFQHALDYLNTYKGNIFVIGGEQIYIEAIKHPLCVKLIINKIEDEDEQSIYYNKQYDTFFPIIDENIYSLDRTETLIKNVVTTFIFGKI